MSGHASFANLKALELSGVTAQTQNPEGGEILKDKSGNPTGLLPETASRSSSVAPATRRRRPRRPKPWARALELADEEVVSKGITSFQDAGSSFELVDRVKRLIDEGKMRVRLWMMARSGSPRALAPTRDRVRQQPPDGPRHQDHRRRRARIARCLAARAVFGSAGRIARLDEPRGLPSVSMDLVRNARRSRSSRATRCASTRSATAPIARC